jgi:hypothetical protein
VQGAGKQLRRELSQALPGPLAPLQLAQDPGIEVNRGAWHDA